MLAASAVLALGLPPAGGPTPTPESRYVHLVTGALDAPPAITGALLVIAHNAGDTAPTARLALEHHAGAIEIDVRAERSELLAAHSTPRPDERPGLRTLAAAWAELPATTTVLLDLKTSSSATIDGAAAAIAAHPRSRVLVSSPADEDLERMQAIAPGALRLRTTRTASEIAAAIAHPGAAEGVAVPARLLTEANVAALRSHGLWVQAYCVNSMSLANRLAAWGANGITTDNVTVMSALDRAASTAHTPG